MLRTNVDYLVRISVMGEVACPFISSSVYNISATGTSSILPGDGGTIYNLRVGNPACSWEADHGEPCVIAENKESDPRQGQRANTVFNIL